MAGACFAFLVKLRGVYSKQGPAVFNPAGAVTSNIVATSRTAA